ncbi:MAG: methionine adenosyltransferase, partial [Desulfurococcales archaeon]|nr:methionine adenosyltransferase [Desulfurococcales archaeon]
VKILSQIGRPIDDPLVADVKVRANKLTSNMKNEIIAIVEDTLENITKYTELILEGKVMLF